MRDVGSVVLNRFGGPEHGHVEVARLHASRVQRPVKPDLRVEEPARLGGPEGGGFPFMRVHDEREVLHEVLVRGRIVDSRDLPPKHRSALEAAFGGGPVRVMDQVNRLMHAVYVVGGPFQLEDGPDAYHWRGQENVDERAGEYPTVFLERFRPEDEAGRSLEYVFQFKVAHMLGA